MAKKWDLKRGTSVYLQVADAHIKHWIKTGKIKAGETVVRAAKSLPWRKPEELEELLPFFTLYKKARHEKNGGTKPSPRAPSLKKQVRSIFIIDDEKELCLLLGDALQSHGFETASAHSKKEALQSLKSSRPDLVLLDLKLPDGDGMSLLTLIGKMSPPPAVMITTAFGSEEAKSEAIKKGACDFLDKPYNEEDVIRRIRKMSASTG